LGADIEGVNIRGRSGKKSKTKMCKKSCSINIQSANAPSRRYAKATAFGGGSLVGNRFLEE
jgi:hypothetical protein